MSLMALFIVAGLVAVVAALGLLFARNAVYAALFLVLNMLALAVLFLSLGAPFLAMVQITVYAGAVMVLFLFVVMLLGAETLNEEGGPIPWQRPLALLLGLVLAVLMGWVILGEATGLGRILPPPPDYAAPDTLAVALFRRYLLPFEVTSVLLLVAMIAALVMVGRRKAPSEETSVSSASAGNAE